MMMVLVQAIALVSEPPGSFVYHLIILFALEAAFAIALGQHRRAPESGAGRLAFAAGVGLAVRVGLALLAGLGAVGLVYDDALLPPLDRAISLVIMLLIGWALLSRPGGRVADGVFGGVLIMLFVAAMVAVLMWQPFGIEGASYNNTLDDKLWQAVCLGVLAALIGLLAWHRPDEWGLALGLFALPMLASIAHLFQSLSSPLLTGHVPAFTRFAELAALPMFAMIAYRQALRQATTMAKIPQPTSFVPLESPAHSGLSPDIARSLAAIGTATDQADVTRLVAEGIGQTFGADLALFWESSADAGATATCVDGYDLTRERAVTGFTVASEQAETLVAAVQAGRSQRMQLPAHKIDLNVLAEQLGLEQAAPALIVPLPCDREVRQALMVCSPRLFADWKDQDDKLLLALAQPVARALANAETHRRLLEAAGGAENDSEPLADWLPEPDQSDEANALVGKVQAHFEQLQQERDELAARVEELAAAEIEGAAAVAEAFEKELSEAREQAEVARLETDRLQQDLDISRQKLGSLSAEQDGLVSREKELSAATEQSTEEISKLEEQIVSLDAERAQLAGRTTELEAELDAVHQQFKVTGAEFHQLQQGLESTQQELKVVTSERDKSASQIQELETSSKVVAEELTETLAQVEQLAEERDQLRAGAAEQNNELAEACAETEAAQQEVESVREQLAVAERDLEALQKAQAAQVESSHQDVVSVINDAEKSMTSILDYADLILDGAGGKIDALQQKFLERIKNIAGRAGALLVALRRVSTIDARGLQLDKRVVNLAGLIDEAVRSANLHFRNQGVTVQTEIADDLPDWEADPKAIDEILHYLLLNAGLASEDGGEVVLRAHLQAEGEPDSPSVRITVQDAGKGIAPKDQLRVFERPNRDQAAPIPGVGDTGVGLNVVKALVEAHSGNIWVESKLGVGATFIVELTGGIAPED